MLIPIAFLTLASSIIAIDSVRNGEPVESDTEFPYLVSLRENGRHVCSGAIINDRWIVTVARCLSGYYNRGQAMYMLRIVAGTKSIGPLDYRRVFYGIEEIYNYADWDGWYPAEFHQLILMKTTERIDLENPRIGKIDLPSGLSSVTEATFTGGWGDVSADYERSNDLRKANVTIGSDDECRARIDELCRPPYTLCSIDGERGPCAGDDGGLLVSDGVLIGILTQADSSCNGEDASVYADLYGYSDFIRSVAEDHA